MTIPTLKIYEIRIVYAYKIFFFEKKIIKKNIKLLGPFHSPTPPTEVCSLLYICPRYNDTIPNRWFK